MGGYLVARWILFPLALILLPLLWGAFITFLQAVASLFSKHAVHRRAAHRYFATILIAFAFGAVGIYLIRNLPSEYALGVGGAILAASLAVSWFAGARAKKQTEEDIDQILADMRKRNGTPPQS